MEIDNGFIGDIKYSILESGKFEEYHPGWKLLNGQTVEVDSGLGKQGITVLPDARDVFLRGMNEGRKPETGDAEGNRSMGTWQADQYKLHRHSIAGPATTSSIIGPSVNFFNEPVRRSDPIYTNEDEGKETRPKNIAVYISKSIKKSLCPKHQQHCFLN